MRNRILFILFCMLTNVYCHSRVTYVQLGANGLKNGTSWANAYPNLDSLLKYGGPLDSVWVANGIHKIYNRSAGMPLVDSTKIFGGFDGSETYIWQRNWSNFLTVLDAQSQFSTSAYGAVVVGFGAYRAATIPYHCRLDGFRVTGAQVYSPNPGFIRYAPILINATSGTVTNPGLGSTADIVNCLIIGNAAVMGGGVGCFGGSGKGEVRVTNCRFENNTATMAGGAIFNGNSNGFGKVGVSTTDSSKFKFIITDCTFKNNTAPVGGAIALWDSTNIINRCTFSGNSATVDGGAIYDTLGAKLSVYNSVLVGNIAKKGSAHYSAVANGLYQPHTFIHNTVAHNVNTETLAPAYAVTLRGGTDTLLNSILWGNTVSAAGAIVSIPFGARVHNNLIPGALISGATGTYTFNPQFKAPGTASTAPFPFSAVYDYRLTNSSWGVDTALNVGLPAPFNLDRNGINRVFGPKPDLGAYELAYCALPMTVTPAGPIAFCLPGSVTIKAGPTSPINTYKYFWNGSISASDSITVSSSGTIRLIGINDTGCRASASIVVNAVPVPSPLISKAGNTLSVPAIYATYQWYKGGVLIPLATTASYTPTSNGVYTVKVSTVLAGCTGTSTSYTLTNLNVRAASMSQGVSIYPNPARGQFYISLKETNSADEIVVSIASLTGQKILTKKYKGNGNSFNQEIDLSGYSKGAYFISIQSKGVLINTNIMIE